MNKMQPNEFQSNFLHSHDQAVPRPPHEQLEEQRFQLKKILEEHRQREANEEDGIFSCFNGNLITPCQIVISLETHNSKLEAPTEENSLGPSFETLVPVQLSNVNAESDQCNERVEPAISCFSPKSCTPSLFQQTQFVSSNIQQANLCYNSEYVAPTTSNAPCYILPGPCGASVNNAAAESNKLSITLYQSHIDEDSSALNVDLPSLNYNHYDNKLYSHAIPGDCSKHPCTGNLVNTNDAKVIQTQTVTQSANLSVKASDFVASGNLNDTERFSAESTSFYIPPNQCEEAVLTADSATTGGVDVQQPASDEEPYSSFVSSSTSQNFDKPVQSFNEKTKEENVILIGPDSLAIPMKHSKRKKVKSGIKNMLVKKQLMLNCEWADCTSTFYVSKEFHEHIDFHLNNLDEEMVEYLCPWLLCGSTWHNCESLIRHILFHAFHTQLKAQGLQIRELESLPNCFLDAERRNLVPQIPCMFECRFNDCKELFQSAQKFYLHTAFHFNSALCINKDGKSYFKCEWRDCNVLHSRLSKLKEHSLSHTQEKVVACPNCGSMFSCKARFHDHLLKQISHQDMRYQCSCCGRKYPTERLLRDHVRQHINHYKCPHCEMTCASQSNLDTHILYRHSSRKPHPCAHCNKAFKQLEDLERHLISHTENKLFKCDYPDCDYCCKCSATLDLHIKKKHLQIKVVYACHLCPCERTRGSALSQHLMKVHSLSWPTGHSKFFYRCDSEGKFRLQTVRFESLELEEGMDRYVELEEGTDRNAADRASSNEPYLPNQSPHDHNESQMAESSSKKSPAKANPNKKWSTKMKPARTSNKTKPKKRKCEVTKSKVKDEGAKNVSKSKSSSSLIKKLRQSRISPKARAASKVEKASSLKVADTRRTNAKSSPSNTTTNRCRKRKADEDPNSVMRVKKSRKKGLRGSISIDSPPHASM
ncbi:zinc finger protein 91 isoform X2 [Hyalella azteca]|uniref:Zinc finger protein 91 isoform X2 n=1 Tax=Hyalella azteca TaxID=294128 RepID=A0A8B7PN47_HYAAZ|nr:zinc finger protein 91 isoform X2 [Hyalella azteca]